MGISAPRCEDFSGWGLALPGAHRGALTGVVLAGAPARESCWAPLHPARTLSTEVHDLPLVLNLLHLCAHLAFCALSFLVLPRLPRDVVVAVLMPSWWPLILFSLLTPQAWLGLIPMCHHSLRIQPPHLGAGGPDPALGCGVWAAQFPGPHQVLVWLPPDQPCLVV